MNPMDLKRGIDQAVAAVVVEIKKKAKKVKSSAEIAQVGTIAANGDATVGEMIAKAMDKVGNDGVITVEEAKTAETELDVRRRHAVRSRLSQPVFRHQCRQDARRAGRAVHPHPREESSAICRRCCRSSKRWCRAGRSLLIISEDVEGEALATLVVNKLPRGPLKGSGRQGAGLGDPPQGDAGRHCGADIGPDDFRGSRASSSRTSPSRCSAAPSGCDREGTTTTDHRPAPAPRRRSRRASPRSRARSRRRRPTTTRKSCRSGGQAVRRCCRHPCRRRTESEVKEKKDRIDDALNATRAAVSRKASCPAAAWRCCAPVGPGWTDRRQ